MEWAFGVSGNELVYIEWISNKVLLHSTGSYIQYPVINHNGKEHEKRMCMYIYARVCVFLLYSTGIQIYVYISHATWHGQKKAGLISG